MGTSDVLGIGLSGTLVADRGIATTSHNIANANTEGYSRQRVEVDTRPPQLTGVGAIGTGVTINNIKRVHNEFLIQELRSNASLHNALQENYNFTSQVDNMLANPDAGLAPTLQKFFDALNGVSNDPSSQSARQVLIGEANSLSERFSYLNNRFESLREATNKDIRATVGDVNELAKAIAELNVAIVRSRELTSKPANDLLDQRDKLVQQLAEKIRGITERHKPYFAALEQKGDEISDIADDFTELLEKSAPVGGFDHIQVISDPDKTTECYDEGIKLISRN